MLVAACGLVGGAWHLNVLSVIANQLFDGRRRRRRPVFTEKNATDDVRMKSVATGALAQHLRMASIYHSAVCFKYTGKATAVRESDYKMAFHKERNEMSP